MKLIQELTDLEVTGKAVPKSSDEYLFRTAARAVVVDESGKIAILATPNLKHYHHKLPGGGVEEGEDLTEALRREIKEEVGCEIIVLRELGEIIEYKNKYNQKQISYCYLAKVDEGVGEPTFTPEEREAGYRVLWMFVDVCG